jgi:hypothetical protein
MAKPVWLRTNSASALPGSMPVCTLTLCRSTRRSPAHMISTARSAVPSSLPFLTISELAICRIPQSNPHFSPPFHRGRQQANIKDNTELIQIVCDAFICWFHIDLSFIYRAIYSPVTIIISFHNGTRRTIIASQESTAQRVCAKPAKLPCSPIGVML